MSQASVPAPSVKLNSFACPVCGAHATQTWFDVYLNVIGGDNTVPTIFSSEKLDSIEADAKQKHMDDRSRAPVVEVIKHFRRMLNGEPFIEPKTDKQDIYNAPQLFNTFVSRCYTCSNLSIWLHDRLLYPPAMTGPAPNSDLSPDVLHDYMEAREILNLSPRGAAALLRLAIEKICIELNAKGKGIDKQIAFLVTNGLPVAVEQALDAVRVIGNEAVHPGQIDLRDDRETATKLFSLVNFIVEELITRPKLISGVYGMIPEEKRKGIEDRNAKALSDSSSTPSPT
jgi:hypothetical protein